MQLTQADLLAIERELCKRSLAEFAKRAWRVLEPATPLKWGWALDAICEHLEAVTSGEIKRLLINVPPGCLKSMLVGVIWPAWEWGPRNLQSMRYLGTAHKQDLAVRDSTKCRRLIQSEWFQKLWPVELTGDQNAKTKFENIKTGFRESMSFTSLTGSRADRVLLDDPLSADDANSEAALRAAEITFTESLPTRVNNDQSAIVVIMQRLHDKDTSGIILKRDLGYVHLCLPMRFEAERKCVTSIGFEDPRTKDGELLFPERFGESQVKELEAILGSYASAGQLQQRPAPREGGMFKRSWFNVVRAIPANTQFVRGWDLAATEGAGDWTVGVKIGRMPSGRFLIAGVERDQLSSAGVERLIVNTASQDGLECRISLPQDPGQAGKAQASYLVKNLAGYNVSTSTESGDKVTRASPMAAQAEAGNIDILEGEWNDTFLNELSVFPAGSKDQTDAASRAFNELVMASRFNLTNML